MDISYTAFGKKECQYLIPNEFELNPQVVPLDPHPGVVAMGGYGEAGLAGCEFFFSLGDCPEHKGIYPVFGRVAEGMDEIYRLGKVDTVPVTDFSIAGVEVNRPMEPQIIEKVELELFGRTYPEPIRVPNPEYAPQRLDDFLSHVLERKVRVKKVLPNDSTRLTDENSLLIMDSVVEFEDGAIGNIEVQKMGYLFPGERSACYSADLLLRQYKRLRDEKKREFSYRDIRTVYTIILFEHSPRVFQAYPRIYRHRFEQKSDTGIKLEMPQKFIYISLDIFRKKQQNEGENIHNRLEAWLTFFCRDEPEMILRLIEEYPEFKALYEDVYELCRNVEGVMQIFSKEVLEMDRNTVRLMIDEMQDEIEKKGQTIKAQEKMLQEKNEALKQKDKEFEDAKQRIKELEKQLLEK